MNSLADTAEAVGFPIQKPPDQSLLGSSPKLIAANHVFRRLLVPRHPPYALSSLLSPTTLHLAESLSRHTNVSVENQNALNTNNTIDCLYSVVKELRQQKAPSKLNSQFSFVTDCR
jgi:hypothetical protein